MKLCLCCIALEDLGDKHREYSMEEVVEEVMHNLKNWEFEERFVKKLLAIYPETNGYCTSVMLKNRNVYREKPNS